MRRMALLSVLALVTFAGAAHEDLRRATGRCCVGSADDFRYDGAVLSLRTRGTCRHLPREDRGDDYLPELRRHL